MKNAIKILEFNCIRWSSSKRHQWNQEKVLLSVQKIVENNPDAEIILTFYCRTPAEFIDILRQQSFAQHLQIFY